MTEGVTEGVARPGRLPSRIVCLTEETTETLYLLGEEARIVGISGFTVRPRRARREKPRVSAFTSARHDKILALEPDLVLGFSDMQADIAATLIRAGVNVLVFNQRSVVEILDVISCLGALVGAGERAAALVAELEGHLEKVRAAAARLPRRPRVYFEEWDAPRICGIRWVSELVTLAGGDDVMAARSHAQGARGRIIEDDGELLAADPEIIIGSWCGKKFRPERVAARAGWERVTAVRDGTLHEVKSPLILQPGPAALTDGVDALAHIIAEWNRQREGAP